MVFCSVIILFCYENSWAWTLGRCMAAVHTPFWIYLECCAAGNESIPVVHVADMKEMYENMKLLLDKKYIKYVNGISVVILRSLFYYLTCNLGISFAIFYVNGTEEKSRISMP